MRTRQFRFNFLMNAWRMALRAGYKGYDLWPACKAEKVAVLTYEGIYDTDLSKYTPANKPDRWALKGSAPSSMINFAWRIRSGDLIFVRDSKADNEMIARGTVKGNLGQLAYRFDKHSKIRDANGTVWRHKIDVAWENSFVNFKYHDRAPNKSVLALNQAEIEAFVAGLPNLGVGLKALTALNDGNQAEQFEDAYTRSSPAMRKVIVPRHKALANCLVRYLREAHSIKAWWERDRIDVNFVHNGMSVLAELKIAYGGGTRHAIREALGQIIEYNHYGKREPFAQWLLILDQQPNRKDLEYIAVLRTARKLPIFLGWPSDKSGDFDFSPSWPN